MFLLLLVCACVCLYASHCGVICCDNWLGTSIILVNQQGEIARRPHFTIVTNIVVWSDTL